MPQPQPQKLAQYRTNQKTWGLIHGESLVDGSFSSNDEALAHIYYDMSYCLWKLKDYLQGIGDADHTLCDSYALAADQVYLNYLLPNYNAQGFRNFPQGFEQSFLRTGTIGKRNAAVGLSTGAAYAAGTATSPPLSWTQDWSLSREVAYAVESYFVAERLGEPVRSRRDPLIEQIFGHFDQWFVTQSAGYVKTFMVGLSARTLIHLYFKAGTSDTTKQRIVTALNTAADWLWANMWVASAGAFRYQSVADSEGTTDPAVDLNQLVSPMYGFLFYVTGNQLRQQQHHTIFDAGVTTFTVDGFVAGGAYILLGKQYNQHYFWSDEGLLWATSDPLTEGGGGTPPPPPPGGGGGTGGGGGSTPPPPDPGGSPGTPPPGGGGGGSSGGTGGSGGSGNVTPEPLVESGPAILAPVRPETWEQHFALNGWDTLQAQIDAGFLFMIQPGAVTAEFEETIDLGAEITQGNLVTLIYTAQVIDGAVTITPTLGYSQDDVTYTEEVGVTQILASAFRYLKVRLEFAATDNKGIVRIPEMRVKIAAKEIRDGGSGTAVATDYTGESDPDLKGTLVLFNKVFADIDQLQVTARYQNLVSGGQAVAYHNFLDEGNPLGFRVFILDSSDGTVLDGDFDWSAKGI